MQHRQPFTHIPCAADVPKEPQYADQRYFTGLAGRNRDVYASGNHIAQLSATKVEVYRHGPDDCAMLTIQVEHHHGKSETTANLKPAELRDLAQRLLDAAHDIEAHPAASLAQRATLEVATC